MLIIPALILVIVFALFMTAVMRPPTRPAAFLSAYLWIYANIVLVGEIANSFYRLNHPWVWIGLHGLLTVGSIGIWWGMKRPSLKAPWVDAEGRFIPSGWTSSLKQWPDLWAFGLGVASIFVFNLILLWVAPPNNNDSLSTHMSRIGYWLQRGAFFPWPSQRIWQITYPVNMQLQIFWTVLFLHNDRIVEIVQWLGLAAALAAVFGLARLLKASRPQALFAAFLLATFPELILEATTTQNDLVAGTLFVMMLYLLFLALERLRAGMADWKPMMGMSGLALALALGTKQTVLFLLPGLGAALLVAWYLGGRKTFNGLLYWGALSAAAFVMVGAYMFVVNQVQWGNPMGPAEVVDSQTGGKDVQGLLNNLVFNTFRLAYQSIDPTGLPDPLTGYSFKLKGIMTEPITRALHFPVEEPIATAIGHQFNLRERYPMQEDSAWYGPLFAFLVLPAMGYQLIRGIKQREALPIGIFLLGISFLLIDAVFRPGWDAFQGRYFIPTVMAATATVALVARPGRWGAVLRWGIMVLALLIAWDTFAWNISKPLSGERTVWDTSRVDQMTYQSFFLRPSILMVDRQVPADATLGLLTFGSFQEYSFFREDFSRRLVQIYPDERITDLDWLKGQGIEYVLVGPLSDVNVSIPEAFVKMDEVEGWALYTWKSGN